MSINGLVSSRLIALSRAIRERRNGVMEAEGLSEGNDAFLLLLTREDGITMGLLADSLGIGAPSATKIATKLEEMGLVRRESSRIDNRQNHCWLTDQGREMAERLASAYSQIDAEILARMRGKDHDRLAKSLDRLETAISGKEPRPNVKPKKPGKKKKKKD